MLTAIEPQAAPHAELETLRPVLLRFAMLHLRNPTLAEDAVQDTLVAVLEHPERFGGLSSLRTYVTGILKHKIVDLLRSAKRDRRAEPAGDDDFDVDALFIADGHTVTMPRAWGDPHATLESADFFRVLELCLENLPEKTARVFMLREWLEWDTDEICQELGCSATYAGVMLYRARLRLRECLDLNWFGRLPEPNQENACRN
jgi:RNA polymerase sigma-70 factor (ECF subfamily)